MAEKSTVSSLVKDVKLSKNVQLLKEKIHTTTTEDPSRLSMFSFLFFIVKIFLLPRRIFAIIWSKIRSQQNVLLLFPRNLLHRRALNLPKESLPPIPFMIFSDLIVCPSFSTFYCLEKRPVDKALQKVLYGPYFIPRHSTKPLTIPIDMNITDHKRKKEWVFFICFVCS